MTYAPWTRDARWKSDVCSVSGALSIGNVDGVKSKDATARHDFEMVVPEKQTP